MDQHLDRLRELRQARDLARARVESLNVRIVQAIQDARAGDVSMTAVAEALGISRATLYEFMARDGRS